jgi:1-acyl-sn-glycerol-3-phosphate acyltransferase
MRFPMDGLPLTQRLNLRAVSALNESPLSKKLLGEYLRTFGAWWVHKATEKIITIDGLDRVRSLDPRGGLVIAANHRSFFDFYVISSILLRHTQHAKRIYFPVRANFFYESPVGFLVNGLVGGFSMYPPIFRDPNLRELNELSLTRIEELLLEKGVVVGFHPEGTRGKGPDPYEILPAQPGIGRALHKTRAPVVPVFVVGLTNNFPHQLINGVRGTVDPVYAFFGEPTKLDDLYAQSARASTYLRIARRVRDDIVTLGQKVKALDESRRGSGATWTKR